jgi:DNA-binding Lrp family transcriptional regulator
MRRKTQQITARLDDRTYYGLIAIGKKLADDGILKNYKGGVSKVASLALEAVVDAFLETGKISEKDIEDARKETIVEEMIEEEENIEVKDVSGVEEVREVVS